MVEMATRPSISTQRLIIVDQSLLDTIDSIKGDMSREELVQWCLRRLSVQSEGPSTASHDCSPPSVIENAVVLDEPGASSFRREPVATPARNGQFDANDHAARFSFFVR